MSTFALINIMMRDDEKLSGNQGAYILWRLLVPGVKRPVVWCRYTLATGLLPHHDGVFGFRPRQRKYAPRTKRNTGRCSGAGHHLRHAWRFCVWSSQAGHPPHYQWRSRGFPGFGWGRQAILQVKRLYHPIRLPPSRHPRQGAGPEDERPQTQGHHQPSGPPHLHPGTDR